MTYEEFKQAWISALRESGLSVIGIDISRETIDLRSTDRMCESFLEPRSQDVAPFHIAAALKWRWSTLHTARTATSEEDLLIQLFGREGSHRRTTRPWVRVDATLHASLPYGKSIAMPSQDVWSAWTAEAIGRLDAIEPLVPAQRIREGRDGLPEFLAWQSEPTARVACGRGGQLRLEAVEVSSWQAIETPRHWSDSNRKPDPGPGEQLRGTFARVRAALHAWMEVTDHLRAGVLS